MWTPIARRRHPFEPWQEEHPHAILTARADYDAGRIDMATRRTPNQGPEELVIWRRAKRDMNRRPLFGRGM